MKRIDDFEKRREHLKNLSDEELYEKFWQLTGEIVKPLVHMAYTHTSPAIERSVLLRMGFSSIEADSIVREGIKWKLLGMGMGNAVLTYAEIKNEDYMKAGENLARGIGWNELADRINGGGEKRA